MTKQYRYNASDPWRVVPFMILGAVLQGGLAIGVSAADSLFISNIGSDKLPIIYTVMPLLMLAYISAYTRVLNRWGIDFLFVATIVILVIGGFGFSFLLRTENPPEWIYYVAMFYGSLWYIALYSLLWNFIDGFFDLSEAKRLFGLIAGGSAAGAIAGGFLVSSLSEVMGVSWLFGVWASSVLMALPIFWWILRNVPRIVGEDIGQEEDEEVSLKDTLRAVLGERYVTTLALVIFMVSLVATLCEFRYYTIFEEYYPDEKALAGLFGQLYAGVNVFNLVVTLFLFRVMVRWIGVRNVALIQPLIFLAVFGFLLLNGGFAAALFGFVAFQGVMTSIEYNNQNLLFNVLPEQGKESTRTFIEGICDPVATACAGIFLLGAQQVLSDNELSGAGFGAALVCLILVLVLRVEFVKSMTANVRRGWLDFSRPKQEAAFVRTTDLEFLQNRADDVAAPERERLAAMERLWHLEPVDTVVRLLNFFPQITADLHPEAVSLLDRILLTDNPKVIDCCLTWAEKFGADCDPLVLGNFGRRRLVPVEIGLLKLRSPDPRDRCAGAVVLWESGRVKDAETSLQVIDDLLEGNAAEMEAGWHALSMIGEIRFIPRLLPNLRSPDPVLRLRALHALQPLMGPDTSGVHRELLLVMAGSKRLEERLLIIEALKRIGDSAIIEPLLCLTTDTVPKERRSLDNLLTSFGPPGVPAAVKVLCGTQYPLASRSIAAKALARVALSQLEQMVPGLIDDIVRRAYVVVAYRHVLKQNADWGPGTLALGLVYQDLPRLMLELVLELLSVIGRLPSYESVLAALRTENGRERGYALESIEQACGRQLFDRLLPILDERPDKEIMAMGRTLGIDSDIKIETVVERSLGSAFPMEASAALQAKVEANPEQVQEICLRSLVAQPHPMVRMTALALMRRSDPNLPHESTVVERVNELVQHVFFRNWGVRSLEAVAEQLDEQWHEEGEVVVNMGFEMDRFGVALEGRFESEDTQDTVLLPTPANFGQESLGQGQLIQRRSVVVKERARILWIPVGALRSCLQAQPRLAIDLLVWKLAQP